MFDVPYEAVDPDTRRLAKTVNFGIIYGISAFGLANSAGVSQAVARDYIKLYFERFPGVKRLTDSIREEALEKGYVSTLLGRRRYFPELQSRNPQVRQAAERAAMNAPIQGTAADIVKRAMIRVDEMLRRENLRAKVLLQVHDELVLEVPAGEVERTCDVVTEAMTGAFELIVPLEVEAKAGQNWDELKPIKQAKREAEEKSDDDNPPQQGRLL
jgi:DNA polymerase-1